MEEKDLSRALSGNPLGVASLIVSILGFAMSLFALSSSCYGPNCGRSFGRIVTVEI